MSAHFDYVFGRARIPDMATIEQVYSEVGAFSTTKYYGVLIREAMDHMSI